MKGKLILVPTPIDEESPLEQVAFDLLSNAATKQKENSLFVIEDLKPGRKRWLRWKLPRDIVDDFVLYNEHTHEKEMPDILEELKKGRVVYLMSDGGLPAFCDPGRDLVHQCHLAKIPVTSTPFSNSISLAIALSGIDHDQFTFGGFLPLKEPARGKQLQKFLARGETLVLMDTPYRMKRLLEEIQEAAANRKLFLGMDLGAQEEELYYGTAQNALASIKNMKREFILVISGN